MSIIDKSYADYFLPSQLLDQVIQSIEFLISKWIFITAPNYPRQVYKPASGTNYKLPLSPPISVTVPKYPRQGFQPAFGIKPIPSSSGYYTKTNYTKLTSSVGININTNSFGGVYSSQRHDTVPHYQHESHIYYTNGKKIKK